MNGNKTARPMTLEEVAFLELIRKIPTAEIAKKMNLTTGSLYTSINRARRLGEITEHFLSRLRKSVAEVVAELESSLCVRRPQDIAGNKDISNHYNDGNNPNVLPLLEALVKKYSGNSFSLDQYDDPARILLDLTKEYGEIKGMKMVLVLLQD